MQKTLVFFVYIAAQQLHLRDHKMVVLFIESPFFNQKECLSSYCVTIMVQYMVEI